jgi:hypothetical protein
MNSGLILQKENFEESVMSYHSKVHISSLTPPKTQAVPLTLKDYSVILNKIIHY